MRIALAGLYNGTWEANAWFKQYVQSRPTKMSEYVNNYNKLIKSQVFLSELGHNVDAVLYACVTNSPRCKTSPIYLDIINTTITAVPNCNLVSLYGVSVDRFNDTFFLPNFPVTRSASQSYQVNLKFNPLSGSRDDRGTSSIEIHAVNRLRFKTDGESARCGGYETNSNTLIVSCTSINTDLNGIVVFQVEQGSSTLPQIIPDNLDLVITYGYGETKDLVDDSISQGITAEGTGLKALVQSYFVAR